LHSNFRSFDVPKHYAVRFALVGLVIATSAQAQVKMEGNFTAAQACPALSSIKQGTNPGSVSVAAGTAYRLLGKNKDQATHYWIEVPGAAPPQRWVAIACGLTDGSAQTAPTPSTGAAVNTPSGTVKPKPNPRGPKDGVPFYVLALSWEPAFCEAKPDKPECKSMTSKDRAANAFSLHGLWPQPRRNVFCGVDPAVAALDDQHQWNKLPEPELTEATRTALDHVMPGTQSLLQRHEYIKHGTCYPGGSAETYFKDETRLTNAVNASAVGAFMAANVGKSIQSKDLRSKFDEAFGAGAGDRVRVACDQKGRISEITIGLKGDIPGGTDIAELIAASTPTDAGCPGGLVDAVN
jgi:ribonuclease T2